MEKKRPVIAITMGDPVGIGPEIIVSALNDPLVYELCRPLVIGDKAVMNKAINLMSKPMSKKLAVHTLYCPEDHPDLRPLLPWHHGSDAPVLSWT